MSGIEIVETVMLFIIALVQWYDIYSKKHREENLAEAIRDELRPFGEAIKKTLPE